MLFLRNLYGELPGTGSYRSVQPKEIIRMAILGMKKEVLSSQFIWLCSSCYTCFERCPQDVKIPELMNAIKNIAVREGHIPPVMKLQLDLLSSFGRLLEVTDFENDRRKELSLPLIQGKTDEIKKILEKLGLHYEEKAEK